METPAESNTDVGEVERTSGKRKLDEAGEGDSPEEEGFPSGRVRRMRVSESAEKNGGASGGVNSTDLAELPNDAAAGTDSKAIPNHAKPSGTAAPALNGPTNEDTPNDGSFPTPPNMSPPANGLSLVGTDPPRAPMPPASESSPERANLSSLSETPPSSLSLQTPLDTGRAPEGLPEGTQRERVLSHVASDAPASPELAPGLGLESDTQSEQLEAGASFHNVNGQSVNEAVVRELPVGGASENGLSVNGGSVNGGSQDEITLQQDTLAGLSLDTNGGEVAAEGEVYSEIQGLRDGFAPLEEEALEVAHELCESTLVFDNEPSNHVAQDELSSPNATPVTEASGTENDTRLTLDAHSAEVSNGDASMGHLPFGEGTGHEATGSMTGGAGVLRGDVSRGGLEMEEREVEEGNVDGEERRGDVNGCEQKRDDMECDDTPRGENDLDEVSGGDGDVSEQGGPCPECGYTERAAGEGIPPAAQLQLLVKLFDGRTVLVRADPSEGPEAVLERVRLKTGVDCPGQRLLYNGRELPPDEPLSKSALASGCTLTLAARLRSSAFPWAFTFTERLLYFAKVALDPGEKRGRREVAANTVTHQVAGLLENARHLRAKGGDTEWGAAKAGVVDVFRTMGGPRMLHALLQAPDDFCRRCAEDCIRAFVSEVRSDYLFPKGRLGLYCLPVLSDFWGDLLADDTDGARDLYEHVTSALLVTLAGKSQWLLRDYFQLSRQGALEFFVGMLERVKERLCAATATLTGCYTLLQRPHEAWLQPILEAKTFGVLCHVVVSAMQSAADDIVHWFDAVQIAPGGERQYTRAAWEEGGLWSRLGEAYIRVQRVLDAGFYDDVAAWWAATEAALCETQGVSGDFPPNMRTKLLFARVVLKDSVRLEVNGVLSGRLYPILDGLAAFAFGGQESPFFARFEALLSGHRAEIDSLAYACPENKAWMFDAPARSHLSVRTRVSWFLRQFPEPEEGGPRFEIVVPRGPTLLPETLFMIGDEESVDLSKLQRGLGVVFDGEEAEGPGVLREWFALIARELFSEEKGLFLAAPGDKRRVLPSPESEKAGGAKHLEYMRLAGHVLGLAILHRVPLGVLLSTAFFKGLARQPLSWTDARDISPDLFKSCQAILDLPQGDVEALGLTFSADVMRDGVVSTIDLVPGGGDITVTGANRADYLDRLVTYRLLTQAEPQVGAFYQGLSVVIAGAQSLERALDIVGRSELERILESAAPEIDVADWRAHTEYSGYTPECDQVRWFWRAVEEMTSEQRRRLLYFATAVAHLPLSGFAGLPHVFRLHRAYVEVDWLPTAHTCFHLFMLPPYTSYEMMRSRLLIVTQDHMIEGFGFV